MWDRRSLNSGGSYPLPSSPCNSCFKTHHRYYVQGVLKYFAIFIDNIAYIAKAWSQVPELSIITIGQMLSCFMWCWVVSLAFPFHSSQGKCVFLCKFLESYVILWSYSTEAIVKLQSQDTGDPDDHWCVWKPHLFEAGYSFYNSAKQHSATDDWVQKQMWDSSCLLWASHERIFKMKQMLFCC